MYEYSLIINGYQYSSLKTVLMKIFEYSYPWLYYIAGYEL